MFHCVRTHAGHAEKFIVCFCLGIVYFHRIWINESLWILRVVPYASGGIKIHCRIRSAYIGVEFKRASVPLPHLCADHVIWRAMIREGNKCLIHPVEIQISSRYNSSGVIVCIKIITVKRYEIGIRVDLHILEKCIIIRCDRLRCRSSRNGCLRGRSLGRYIFGGWSGGICRCIFISRFPDFSIC